MAIQKNAHWLKLTLNAPQNVPLLLTVVMSVLDDVRLYVPDDMIDSNARIPPNKTEVIGWNFWQQDDLFAFNQREINWRGFSFPLQTSNQKMHTVYLRVVSTSTHLIVPQLWSTQQFVDYQKNEMLLFGFVMGAMLVFLLLAIISYFFKPEILQTYYLLLMIASIFYLLIINGFLGQWILFDAPELSSNCVGIIVGLLQIPAFGFHREFLFGKIRHSLIYRMQSVVMFFGFVTAGFALLGKYNWIAEAFALMVFSSLFIAFLFSCWLRLKKILPNKPRLRRKPYF